MDDPHRVFLRHTSELNELPIGRSFVAAARSAVERAGHVVVEMFTLPPAHLPTEDVCREQVRSSTVFVLIAGFRYGSTPPDRPGVSYAELEFDTAAALGTPRIVILLGEDPTGADAPADKRQIAFRDRLRRSGVVATGDYTRRAGDRGPTRAHLAGPARPRGSPGSDHRRHPRLR